MSFLSTVHESQQPTFNLLNKTFGDMMLFTKKKNVYPAKHKSVFL